MTQTHVLLTALAVERAGRAGLQVRGASAVFGSLAPDLPLLLLTLWYAVVVRPPGAQVFAEAYDAYFFQDPLWIVSHNLLHAPLVLAALFAFGHALRSGGRGAGGALRWFVAGAAGHTLIDVFTHRGDGPLLLFPFDWSFRFMAPVSYWDPRHGGNVVFPLEVALNVVIVAYFTLLLRRRRRGTGVARP